MQDATLCVGGHRFIDIVLTREKKKREKPLIKFCVMSVTAWYKIIIVATALLGDRHVVGIALYAVMLK